MNKYLIPVCDIEAGSVWIEYIVANSIQMCQDKLMDKLSELYDIDNTFDYRKFVDFLDTEFNILVGEIKDIEEL